MAIPTKVNRSSREPSALARDVLRGLAGVLAGVAISTVILLLAVLSAGAGHGSYIPYIVFVFPRNYGLLVWPLVGLFVCLRQRRWAGRVAGLLLLSYLALVGYHVFVYLGFRAQGIEPPVNLFTVLAVVVWIGAVTGGMRLVAKRLRQSAS
jgi:hypothetical protein